MTTDSERLREETRQLRALARDVDAAPGQARHQAESIPWHGPAADRTRGDLAMWATRFGNAADALVAEAAQRECEADQAEARQRAEQAGAGP